MLSLMFLCVCVLCVYYNIYIYLLRLVLLAEILALPTEFPSEGDYLCLNLTVHSVVVRPSSLPLSYFSTCVTNSGYHCPEMASFELKHSRVY